MDFSQDSYKIAHLSIKAEQGPSLSEIQSTCSSGLDALFSQNDSQFLAIDDIYGLNNLSEDKTKTIKYYFPSIDDIDTKLSDPKKMAKSVQENVPTTSKQRIDAILEQVKKLSSVEKLLLYLKLPTGKSHQDPTKLPANPLGSRQEIAQTISWIKTHLKEDRSTSIPKQDVYNEYLIHCEMTDMKPLSTADFGKVMKQIYPNVRPRRLGTRGHSRYCYSGMSCRNLLPPPLLPMVKSGRDEGGRTCAWAAQVLGTPISSLSELEAHLASRGLPTGGQPIPPSHASDENTYIRSSKISKAHEERLKNPGKNNAESVKMDDTNLPNTTPPERCKGRKRNAGGKKGNPPPQEEPKAKIPKVDEAGAKKMLIPRLPMMTKEQKLMPCPRKPAPKPLQPKQEQVFVNPAKKIQKFLEPPKYVQHKFIEPKKVQQKFVKHHKKAQHKFVEPVKKVQKKFQDLAKAQPKNIESVKEVKNEFQVAIDEPKVSQLRMLLERKGSKTPQVKRRVSFELPASEYSQTTDSVPKSSNTIEKRTIKRSNSMNSAGVNQGEPDEMPQPIPLSDRSKSVPTLSTHDTPIPTEMIDFGFDGNPNLLVIDETSESLLMESGINNENLNAIFSIISEMESNSRGYQTTSDYPETLNQSIIPSTSGFFDVLDCDINLSHLNVDLAQLTAGVL